jgi:hypothetical protein
MDKDLRYLLAIWRWGKFALAAADALATWKVALLALAEGLRPYEVALIASSFFLLASTGLYYFFKLVDRAVEGIERFKTAWRLAQMLESMRLGGRRTVGAQQIVNLWYEEQPQNRLLRLAKKEILYGVLRRAVIRGWIRADLPENAAMNYECNIDDVITFFRERRWLQA